MDYPDPWLVPASEFPTVFARLHRLLHSLPNQLPERSPSSSKYGSFLDHSLDLDIFEKTEDEVATVSEQLKRVFGWDTRSSGDGIVSIEERGEGICAIEGFLRHWHEKYPEDNVLKKWIIDILRGAEKVYRDHGQEIPADVSGGASQSDSVSNKRPRSETLDAHFAEASGLRRKKSAVFEEVTVLTKNKGGRPPDPLTRRAATEYFVDPGDGSDHKKRWKCIACGHSESGHIQTSRVKKHAASCPQLQKSYPALYAEINGTMVKSSLGAKVTVEPQASSSSNQSYHLTVPEITTAGPSSPSQPLRKAFSQSQLDTAAFKSAGGKKKEKDQQERQDKINHAILMLLCVHGLPPGLVDSGFWKYLVSLLDIKGTYRFPSSTDFVTKYIPQEAAFVKQQTLERLQGERNLTMTFDGTTIRKPTSLYTVHATTAKRETYFLSGHHDGPKSKSHNAIWVTEKLAKDITEVGVGHWGAVCSDNTSVTKLARQNTHERWNTIEDLRDSVHLIQNTIEEITKLPEHKGFASTMKEIVKFFKKSTNSTLTLLEEAERLKAAAGLGDGETANYTTLKSVGKTRFGTYYICADALKPHLTTIHALYKNGKLTFKSKRLQEVFSKESSAKFVEFEQQLNGYMYVVEPFVRALWSLEAASANASDVIVFWVSIAGVLDARFENPRSPVELPLANKITNLYNKRYKEMFLNDIYFVALMLDPRFDRNDILTPDDAIPLTLTLRIPQTSAESARLASSGLPGQNRTGTMPFRSAYCKVRDYLRDSLRAMCQFAERYPTEGEPLLVEIGSAEAIDRLKAQLPAFWLGSGIWLANKSLKADSAYDWWIAVGRMPDADVLSLLATKVFGTLTNSMPDERTNSAITWLNSAIRGTQLPDTVVNNLHIRQWYLSHAVPPEVRRLMTSRQKAASGPPVSRPAVAFKKLRPDLLRKVQGLDVGDSGTSSSNSSSTPEGIMVSDTFHLREEEEESSDEEGPQPQPLATPPAPVELSTDSDDAGERVNFKVHKEIKLDSKALTDMISDEGAHSNAPSSASQLPKAAKKTGTAVWDWVDD
ncbi:ribonuclease H-like domain-containing protein [Ephemerocybe angulata]|uniref:Ribonuclease H-like domain-containing protein n=1 Tax=Ephemerocybe angulata TaxID=980116 RepID=A0A8H6HJN0_9AGAR|nr:ribonuclease H-like domain-containing protein [Tulosesus angulatus]